MAENTFLPCPFCSNSDTLATITNEDGERVVYCHRCGARGPQYAGRGWYWNSRLGEKENPPEHDKVKYVYFAGKTFWDWIHEDHTAAVFGWILILTGIIGYLLGK